MESPEKVTFIARGTQGVGPTDSGDTSGAVIRLVKTPKVTTTNTATGQRETGPGVTIEFRQGRYATDDPEVIDWLRSHKQNANNSAGVGGMFVELGNEPGRPKPEYDEVVDELMDAQLRGDVQTIVARRDKELETFARNEVLILCRKALEKLAEHGEESARDALEHDPETAVTPA